MKRTLTTARIDFWFSVSARQARCPAALVSEVSAAYPGSITTPITRANIKIINVYLNIVSGKVTDTEP
jgi:hypothetical protein